MFEGLSDPKSSSYTLGYIKCENRTSFRKLVIFDAYPNMSDVLGFAIMTGPRAAFLLRTESVSMTETVRVEHSMTPALDAAAEAYVGRSTGGAVRAK